MQTLNELAKERPVVQAQVNPKTMDCVEGETQPCTQPCAMHPLYRLLLPALPVFRTSCIMTIIARMPGGLSLMC